MPISELNTEKKSSRKYKSSVFTLLFSEPNALLELYSAISGKNYSKDTQIKIVTLSDALYMEQINDIAFVLEGKLIVLIEHQSTINENMPLRMLIYIGREYERIVDRESLYRTKRMEIPVPEFIVLYNGKEPMEDYRELRLSDLFASAGIDNPLQLELVAKVYNINDGKNVEFAERSATLKGYETFISEVRKNENTMSRAEAIRFAVRNCIDRNILQDFLKDNSSEVENMLLGEWNWTDAERVWRAEGRAEGEAKGRAEGEAKGRAEGEATLLEKVKQLIRQSKNLQDLELKLS